MVLDLCGVVGTSLAAAGALLNYVVAHTVVVAAAPPDARTLVRKDALQTVSGLEGFMMIGSGVAGGVRHGGRHRWGDAGIQR